VLRAATPTLLQCCVMAACTPGVQAWGVSWAWGPTSRLQCGPHASSQAWKESGQWASVVDGVAGRHLAHKACKLLHSHSCGDQRAHTTCCWAGSSDYKGRGKYRLLPVGMVVLKCVMDAVEEHALPCLSFCLPGWVKCRAGHTMPLLLAVMAGCLPGVMACLASWGTVTTAVHTTHASSPLWQVCDHWAVAFVS